MSLVSARRNLCLIAVPVLAGLALAQVPNLSVTPPRARPQQAESGSYVLGPGDQISIWALGAEEISSKTPLTIDPNGGIDLPLVGHMQAGGRTVQQLKADLIEKLRVFVREPEVSITTVEYRSQPISVMGAVKEPGVKQLQGSKSLFEVLSMAGGPTADAGPKVLITRNLEYGAIPLESAKTDPSGRFSVAEVNLQRVLAADQPQDNILVRPNDVITVPRADMVYVIGEVNKPGGFVLNDKESMSVLQALSLAGGTTRYAAPSSARVLRPGVGGNRQETALNLKHVLAGRTNDVPLKPQDILFVPSSATKNATLRAIEAGIQVGTGVLIFRR
ncbi:MAG TPA: polysaccharide biosynthesis/export family protein [Bryobacteraceae bacterium]|nr:polysaccharide biosynthesis/export family protein [Bryobacteraceae bacterium]